ncbi:MAG: HTH domain-containing protein [Candidatus Sabulitectum sp.]|nr:HTH domain-containing protein [Candidatus Sabulitectum sp.]
MDRTERFYKIDMFLREISAVPLSRFAEEMEVSRSTVKRDIEYLRDRFNAPIVWDRSQRGYRYGRQEEGMPQYSLPGLKKTFSLTFLVKVKLIRLYVPTSDGPYWGKISGI